MLKETNKEIRDRLYSAIQDAPIIDYHCHLAAEEIYKDEPFDNIGELWLKHDHYKWRLMRSYGISEEYITGGTTSFKDKFLMFVSACERAFGNPVKEWAKMELKTFFNIELPLNSENVEMIWEKANSVIKEKKMSPKKCIEMCNVHFIATTDDICDDLIFHEKLKGYSTIVTPSFRTDRLLEFLDNSYLKILSGKTSIDIQGIEDLEKALELRLEYFIKQGCRFSDVGLENFPSKIASRDEAEMTLKTLIKENYITNKERNELQGYLFIYLGKIYASHNIVMQWHVSCKRNPNKKMLGILGKDSGFDCVGDTISIKSIESILNKIAEEKLPKTIIYTLNPAMYYPLITLCGAFRDVIPGMAWWFNDSERGITNFLETVAELGHIEELVGMLTDSRSFLSYPRHYYFRLILCDFLSRYFEGDNYQDLLTVAQNLSYINAEKLVK